MSFHAGPPPSLFKKYLSTIYEERDFQAHHRLHSDRAYLLAGPRVDRRADLPLSDYVKFMQLTFAQLRWDSATLRRREPRFGDARLRWHRAPAQAEGETLALVSVHEAHTGAELWAAFGVAPEQGRWALRWVTLAAAQSADPPADEAAALALWRALRHKAAGELALVPQFTDERTLLLSMLEVSYFQQHLLSPEALSYLPEARFTCQGAGRCCTQKFSARLSENDRAALDALTPALGRSLPLYKRLPEIKTPEDEARPYLLLHTEAGDCRLLSDAGRCRVHEEAGFAVFHDCHIFPYGFTRTPEGVAVWTSLFCPTVRAGGGAPLSENDPDLRGRLQRTPRRWPQRFWRAAGEEIAWTAFRDAEQALLRYLAGESGDITTGTAPLRARLLGGLRWLARWADPTAAPPPYDPALLTELLGPASAEDLARAEPLLTLFARADYFQPLAAPVEVALNRGPGSADAALQATPFLPYLLRTLVFSKFLSYPHGVVPGFTFVVLAYCLLVRRFAGWQGQEIPAQAWEHAVNGLQHGFFRRQVAHLLLHDPDTQARSAAPLLGEQLLRATLGVAAP